MYVNQNALALRALKGWFGLSFILICIKLIWELGENLGKN